MEFSLTILPNNYIFYFLTHYIASLTSWLSYDLSLNIFYSTISFTFISLSRLTFPKSINIFVNYEINFYVDFNTYNKLKFELTFVTVYSSNSKKKNTFSCIVSIWFKFFRHSKTCNPASPYLLYPHPITKVSVLNGSKGVYRRRP
jgi:hypothetical protein